MCLSSTLIYYYKLTWSKFSGHGRTFQINSILAIDILILGHHSSDLCVIITFQARTLN